jgi:RimJ/RimL family protein N-acetyltransferase
MPAMTVLFETPRLRCRHWRPDDLETLCAVYGDAAAMRFVGDGEPLDRAGCERWLEVTAANLLRRGYGMSALEDRGNGRVLGFIGLVHPGEQAEPELKYALHRDAWGRGLAREAAAAMLAHGARVHGLRRVTATVHPDHLASRRVLLAVGASLTGVRRDAGGDTHVFTWHALDARGRPEAPGVLVSPLWRHPDRVVQVADWFRTEWPGWYGPGGAGDAQADAAAFAASPLSLPVGLLAWEDGEPVGVGALKPRSLPSHEHLGPWAAAGFVRPTHRGRGLGAALLRGLCAHAAALGVPTLYCGTATAASLLEREGWQRMDSVHRDGHDVRIYHRATAAALATLMP